MRAHTHSCVYVCVCSMSVCVCSMCVCARVRAPFGARFTIPSCNTPADSTIVKRKRRKYINKGVKMQVPRGRGGDTDLLVSSSSSSSSCSLRWSIQRRWSSSQSVPDEQLTRARGRIAELLRDDAVLPARQLDNLPSQDRERSLFLGDQRSYQIYMFFLESTVFHHGGWGGGVGGGWATRNER